MAVDHIRYDILAQQALRTVVRRVLGDVVKKGLPGEHHFYISFDTAAEGVRLSPRLREQYPQEMTIVLQHQFHNLTVNDERFEVGLSFGGVPERLSVPFEAIKAFFDPSVQFGLQFEAMAEEADSAPKGTPMTIGSKPGTPAPLPNPPDGLPPVPALVPVSSGKSEGKNKPAENGDKSSPDGDKSAPDDKPEGGAEVVRLDRFRKK